MCIFTAFRVKTLRVTVEVLMAGGYANKAKVRFMQPPVTIMKALSRFFIFTKTYNDGVWCSYKL